MSPLTNAQKAEAKLVVRNARAARVAKLRLDLEVLPAFLLMAEEELACRLR